MFIAALITIAKMEKQPKCPSTDEWIDDNVVEPYSGMSLSQKRMGPDHVWSYRYKRTLAFILRNEELLQCFEQSHCIFKGSFWLFVLRIECRAQMELWRQRRR